MEKLHEQKMAEKNLLRAFRLLKKAKVAHKEAIAHEQAMYKAYLLSLQKEAGHL